MNYVTKEGLEKMKAELELLESIERPKITQQIAEARDKGDLSENAEYDAAKEAQGLLEMKISKIKDTIYLCTLETNTFFLKDIKGNEHILPKHNNCSKCNKYITKNDDGLIWVRIKQNQIKTILCPSCVAANPNLNQ